MKMFENNCSSHYPGLCHSYLYLYISSGFANTITTKGGNWRGQLDTNLYSASQRCPSSTGCALCTGTLWHRYMILVCLSMMFIFQYKNCITMLSETITGDYVVKLVIIMLWTISRLMMRSWHELFHFCDLFC